MDLKPGSSLWVEVEDLSPQGLGVANVDTQTVWVRQALPGDKVQAVVTRRRLGRIEARLLKVEQPSPHRVLPLCRHFGPCGGCALQHMDYPTQIAWKQRMLKATFEEALPGLPLPDIRVVPMTSPWHHRAKMEFTFGQQANGIVLGLHRRGSFERIVDIDCCEIAPHAVSALLKALKDHVNRSGLEAYRPKDHRGFWRYAIVRSSYSKGELMLLLVTQDGPRSAVEALVDPIFQAVPELKSFYWGIATKVSDVADVQMFTLLRGTGMLEDEVAGIRFHVGPIQFVQPNVKLAHPLYETIRTEVQLSGKEAIYDLYCGIGLIALALASKAKWVCGVESVSENVRLAEMNAKLNGASNTTFVWGKVEDLLKKSTLFKLGPAPDVIVLDPPRAGLHPDAYAPLLKTCAPTILYLSCNPTSLARDLKVLLERDPKYRLQTVHLFDFFPHTPHAEVLAVLRRG